MTQQHPSSSCVRCLEIAPYLRFCLLRRFCRRFCEGGFERFSRSCDICLGLVFCDCTFERIAADQECSCDSNDSRGCLDMTLCNSSNGCT